MTSILKSLFGHSPFAPKRSLLADIATLPRAPRSFAAPGSAGLPLLNQSLFNSKLEKHIDDVRHGDGNLSLEVGVELSQKTAAVGQALASSDPKALQNYSAYSTLLGYDKRARYVSAVDTTTRSLGEIPSEEESKAAVEDLVKAFYPER